jgi:hypothetical protein
MLVRRLLTQVLSQTACRDEKELCNATGSVSTVPCQIGKVSSSGLFSDRMHLSGCAAHVGILVWRRSASAFSLLNQWDEAAYSGDFDHWFYDQSALLV